MFQGFKKAIRLDISNFTQKSTDVSFFRDDLLVSAFIPSNPSQTQ